MWYATYFSANAGKAGSILRISSCIFPPGCDIIFSQGKEETSMTVKERILALKLLEKQEQNPEYAVRIGIQVSLIHQDPEIKEDNHV